MGRTHVLGTGTIIGTLAIWEQKEILNLSLTINMLSLLSLIFKLNWRKESQDVHCAAY